MCHGNRKSTFVMLGIAGMALALAFAFGISPAYVLILAVCPLMMFFMMRGMHGAAPPTPQDASPTDADASTKAHHHDTHPR